MNYSLTLRQLIFCVEAYLDRGHASLANSNAGHFTQIVKQSSQAGFDPAKFIRDCLPALKVLDHVMKRIRERWIGVSLRVAGVLSLILVIRSALLSEMSENMFSEWIVLDRLCGCCVILVALVLGISLKSYIVEFFWISDWNRHVWHWFSDFLVLRDSGDVLPELRERLRDIRLAEITHGVDGHDARQRIYLSELTHETNRLEDVYPRIAYISIVMEWLAYICATIGFVLTPFLAWIEASAGLW